MDNTFSVPTMSCAHCKTRIEKALLAAGYKDGVTVNLEAKTVTVKTGDDPDKLAAIIAQAGYPATLI